MKIVQIDGIHGLLTVAFIGICLFAGFVIFPGLVAMELWNKYLVSAYMFPVLNLFQGVLLWGIIASVYAIIFKKSAVSFKDAKSLSASELDMIMKKTRVQNKFVEMSKFVQKMDKFEKSNPFEEDKTDYRNDDDKSDSVSNMK